MSVLPPPVPVPAASGDMFDLDGVKDDVNRLVIAIGFLLVVLSGFVDWYEYEGTVSNGEYTETYLEGDRKGKDVRDAYDNAKYLWFLSFIGLGAILLSNDVLNQYIDDKNYGNLFLGLGVVCLLLAYSVYADIKEDEEDLEDAVDAYTAAEEAYYSYYYYDVEIDGDLDMKYKMGYYMALIGPLGVLYGGYNLYNENKNGHEF